MATNDFLVFGGGAGANVLSQAAWAALTARTAGFSSGVAQSAQLNKAWRQSSIMAAVLGQFIADQSGQNAVDDGTTATLQANFLAAIRGSKGIQRFTANGSFVVPAGVTTLYVSGCGGGGGGGGSGAVSGVTSGWSAGGGGGGGGGGDFGLRQAVAVTPGQTLTITIGAGGSGGLAGAAGGTGGTGIAGGATTIVGTSVSVSWAGGSGGVGGAGSLNSNGLAPLGGAPGGAGAQSGSCGLAISSYGSNYGGSGGSGAGSPFGSPGGGRQGVAANVGQAASGYGCGGAGASGPLSSSANAGAAGGAGSPGAVFLEW